MTFADAEDVILEVGANGSCRSYTIRSETLASSV